MKILFYKLEPSDKPEPGPGSDDSTLEFEGSDLEGVDGAEDGSVSLYTRGEQFYVTLDREDVRAIRLASNKGLESKGDVRVQRHWFEAQKMKPGIAYKVVDGGTTYEEVP